MSARVFVVALACSAYAGSAAVSLAASDPSSQEPPGTASLSGRLPPPDHEPPELIGAELEAAPLVAARLWGADLRAADLRNAQLQAADLRNADLRGARLDGALLQGARLVNANLRGASLRGAKLAHVDLRGADLTLADLRGADFFVEPDWDSLAQAIETRVPARVDRRRLLRTLDTVRKRAPSVAGATLDRTLLDRPVCVFPPVSAIDLLHDYDKGEGAPLTATAEGFAPRKYFGDRTTLLGKVACAEGAGRIARAFAAELAADRRTPAKESGIDAVKLAHALLAEGCKGGQALPPEVRNELMQKRSEAN